MKIKLKKRKSEPSVRITKIINQVNDNKDIEGTVFTK